MEIKIVTTKKNLTKSIISQMPFPSLNVLKHGIVHGFMLGVKKSEQKTILIEFGDEYYTISAAWEKGNLSVYKKFGRWSQSKKFESAVECDKWWEAYESVLAKATVHIYI